MNYFTAYIKLTRPKTLIASISPVLLASALALFQNQFDFYKFCLLLSTGISLQILANVANDYFDGIKGTDSSQRVGPLRLTGSGLVDPLKVKKILLFVFLNALILGLILSYIGGPLIAMVFGIALVSAILYTAGPAAFSYNGIAEPMAFLFFGPIPTLFASYIYSKNLGLLPILLGCLPGFYSVILMTINNLRDYESDKNASKHTLIVKKGKSFGKAMILSCLLSVLVVSLVICYFQPKFIFSLIALPEAFMFYKQVNKSQTPPEFFKLLSECSKIFITSSVLWISFLMI